MADLQYFRFAGMWRASGWLTPAFVGVDSAGSIRYLDTRAPEGKSVEYIDGHALPGFQNAHSHAFQYAMAGQAESHAPGASDDFWSWREAMYKRALSMNPDQMQAVATMLYADMLRKGYTHVAEFHYLHHDKDGRPYAHIAEMGERLLEAAQLAGIKITLIPVFYQRGGFGMEPQPRQRRFISRTIDEFFSLLSATEGVLKKYPRARLGFSVHSLRAVNPDDIKRTFLQGPKNLPFHLHLAEQLKEVDDCIAQLKRRPAQWLLENLPVDDRFHLVHCTHLSDDEVVTLAASGAHAVLCPGTEGNLGDGIFRLTDFKHAGGTWSIGTDSHISLNPLEDLRWLDYGQRLLTHRRNTFDDGASALINTTQVSGRKAMGEPIEFFEIGASLDAVVYKAPLLEVASSASLLSRIVYTSDTADCIGTMVDGKWVVKNQHHRHEKAILENFRSAMKTIQF